MKKRKRSQAPYISHKERERLILCQAGEKYEKRNVALIRLGFATGFRACEIRDLCFFNIYNDNWELKEDCYIYSEQTKGTYGEGEFFLVGKKVRRSIQDYVDERKYAETLSLNDAVFRSKKGGHFKVNALRILIKNIFNKASVTGSSHSFRRTFATDFTKNNPDPKALQKALRHASPVMSLEYVSKNPELIKHIIKNFVQD